MATSGQINTNTTYQSYFWVKWEQKDQDVPNNRTKIAWSCGVTSSHYFLRNAIKMSAVTINGTQVYSGGTYSNFNEGTNEIASGTMWIDHDSDGTKTLTISAFTGWLYSNNNYSSNGGSYALEKIPRQATITEAPNFTSSGSPPTIKYSNPAGDSVSVLEICIAEETGYTAYISYRPVEKTGTSYTFTDEDMEALKKLAGSTLSITFVLHTKIGNSDFYSVSDKLTFTMVEDDTTKPVVKFEECSINNGSLPTKFEDLYIQGKSKLDVSLSAEGKYGEDIKSYSVQIDGKTYNSQGCTSDVIQSSGKVDVIGYAKDSRGFTGSVKTTIDVIPYSKPLVVPLNGENAILCYRSDGNGKRVGNSTSVWIKAKRTYYSIDGKNQCALQWRKKLTTEEWKDSVHLWLDLITKTDTSTDECNAMLSGEVFDLKKSYTVQIKAIDEVGEHDIKTLEIPTMDVALHLGKGGKNVSVGTYCDYSKDYTFYSEWDAYFDKDVNVFGKLNAAYIAPLGDYIGLDLNNLTARTGYYISGSEPSESNGSKNFPVTQTGMLTVVGFGSFAYQTYTTYVGLIYTRSYYERSGWTSWKQIQTI